MLCVFSYKQPKKSRNVGKEVRNLSKYEESDLINLVASNVITILPQIHFSLRILQMLLLFERGGKKPHINPSLVESFLLGRINLKSVPKLTFPFILVIQMYNKMEASGFGFLTRGLSGLVHTGDTRHWFCHPSG